MNTNNCFLNRSYDTSGSSIRRTKDDNRRLHAACEEGNVTAARGALARSAEVNSRDEQLRTPLHLACRNGHLQLCQVLIDSNCFKNYRDNRGRTPLLEAVENGHIPIVKYLIENGAFCFVTDNDGNSSLHLAAINNDDDMLNWLLGNCDIDSEITNGSGKTYSFYLRRGGGRVLESSNVERPTSGNVVRPQHEILPENFVKNDIERHSHPVYKSNISVIETAEVERVRRDNSVKDAHSRDVSTLFNTSACIKACFEDNFAVACQFLESGINSNGRDDESEMTLLHLACRAGEVDFAARILDSGADVNAQDKQGNTPLHYAAKLCNFELMNLLFEFDADIIGNKHGCTPLHEACCENNEGVVKSLVSMGARVDDIDFFGNTPLHFVVESGDSSLCNWLCQQPGTAGCVHVANVDGLTPYDLARNSGQIEVSSMLLRIADLKKIHDTVTSNSKKLVDECMKGNWEAADLFMKTFIGPNVIDLDWLHEESGKRTIHFCSEGGDLSCVTTLISLGAQVDAYDSTENKKTALHYACSKGHIDVVDVLLSNGANVNAEDSAGYTPLFHACRNNFVDVGCLLVEVYDAALDHVSWKTLDSILHLACMWGSVHWINLIEKYSSYTVLSDLKNKAGQNPLDIAVSANNTDIILFAKQKREKKQKENVMKCANALCNGNLHAALDIAKEGVACNIPVIQSVDFDGAPDSPTLLHLACEKGDVNVVKELIVQGASVNLTDSNGLAPIHYACMGYRPTSLFFFDKDNDYNECPDTDCESRQLEVARWLKKCKADIYVQDKNGMTPFLLCCLHGNLNLAQWFLHRGADTQITDIHGNSPLHLACESGNTQLVKWLIKEEDHGGTNTAIQHNALMSHAAKSGNIELLAYLYHFLDTDRSVFTHFQQIAMENKLNFMIKHQEKKFRKAAFEDDISTMDVILSIPDMPVDINAPDSSFDNKWGAVMKVSDMYGDTALHYACRGQKKRAVKYLLNKMANVNATNRNGITPLHIAAMTGNHAIFDMLLEYGSDINVVDTEGNSVLAFACMQADDSMIERICHQFTFLSEFHPNFRGITPFRIALQNQNYDLVLYFAKNCWIMRQKKMLLNAVSLQNEREIQSLLDIGASANCCSDDSWGRTPLHIAVSLGNLNIIKLLLSVGARVDAVDASGRNSLHIASMNGSVEIVKLLLLEFPSFSFLQNSNGEENTNTDAVLHAVDELGLTPFAHACQSGQMITAAFLIGQGASLLTKDIYGSGIQHMACRSGNISLVEWLLNGFDLDFTELNNYKQSPIDIANDANHTELVDFLTCYYDDKRRIENEAIFAKLEAERKDEICRIERLAKEQEQAKSQWESDTQEQRAQLENEKEAKKLLQLVVKESLAKACEEGSVDDVREILSCDINPNMILTDEDRNGLHIAAFYGHASVIEVFLKTPGIDCDVCDKSNMTALQIACAKAHKSCVEIMVRLGCDPLLVQQSTGQSAVDTLCCTDNAALLRAVLVQASKTMLNKIQTSLTSRIECSDGKSLIERMINVNSHHCLEELLGFVTPTAYFLDIPDSSGKTALNLAASLGRSEFVRILLEFAIEIDCKDYNGLTPLMNAITSNSLEVAKVLVNAGASIYEVDARGNSPLHLCNEESLEIAAWLVQLGADIHCENADGYSPLTIAEKTHNEGLIRLLKNVHNSVLELLEGCQCGDIEWVEQLIKKKVCLQICNKEGMTGLHMASSNGHVELCKRLVSEGCVIDVEDREGRTPLHHACLTCNLPTIQFLENMGSSLFRRDSKGESCLHFVAQSDPNSVSPPDVLKCLSWFVEKKHFSVDVCSDDENTLLMVAARVGNISSLTYLHDRGASVSKINTDGYNAFHLAVKHSQFAAANWLLEHYPNDISVDSPDSKGRSAFMIACECHNLEAMEWLYKRGCNFKRLGSSVDNKDTALHTACRDGDRRICEWLVRHAANVSHLNNTNESAVDVARIHSFTGLAEWLEDCSEASNENQLRDELQISLNTNACSSLQTALLDELYKLYLSKSKIDDMEGTTRSFDLAPYLLNFSAIMGDIEIVRGVLFNAERHIARHDELVGLSTDSGNCFDIINAKLPASGRTPLFNAVQHGHTRITQFLLSHGAHCNIPDNEGNYLINVAKRRKNIDKSYEILLSYTNEKDLCDPLIELSGEELYSNHWIHENDMSDSSSQLMKYCFLGEGYLEKIVHAIEDLGADINYTSSLNLTPLLVASHENHLEIVKYLVECGADVNYVDRNNSSALIWACRNNNRSMVMYLISNHADMSILDSITGESALHILCKNDMIETMEDIIDLPRSILRNLDLKTVNEINGNSLLHYAVKAKSYKMAALLVHQGVDVNMCNECDDMNSPLHYACMNGLTHTAELLLSNQAAVNVANQRGETPMGIALNHRFLDLAGVLQRHGADLKEFDETTGDNFLHKACREGQVDVAKWLVRAGLNPNDENKLGVTATKIAHASGKDDLLEWMLASVLAIQLNKPIEEVLTEAHAMPLAPGERPTLENEFLSSDIDLEENDCRHEEAVDILEYEA